MINREKIYAGLTSLCIAASAAGGYELYQNYGASADNANWNAQKGQLALELKDGLPQILTTASLRDQQEYVQKRDEIKAIDSKIESDPRSEDLEILGGTAALFGAIASALSGVHWHNERRARIRERERKVNAFMAHYNSSKYIE